MNFNHKFSKHQKQIHYGHYVSKILHTIKIHPLTKSYKIFKAFIQNENMFNSSNHKPFSKKINLRMIFCIHFAKNLNDEMIINAQLVIMEKILQSLIRIIGNQGNTDRSQFQQNLLQLYDEIDEIYLLLQEQSLDIKQALLIVHLNITKHKKYQNRKK